MTAVVESVEQEFSFVKRLDVWVWGNHEVKGVAFIGGHRGGLNIKELMWWFIGVFGRCGQVFFP